MANKSIVKSFGHALVEGTLKAIAFHITLTYIIPIGVPVAVLLVGYFSDLPWFSILLGTLAAFAFISGGLLWFSQWLFFRRIEDKLVFESVIFGRNIKNENEIFIGVKFDNTAAFPLEYQVTHIRSQIQNLVPQNSHEQKKYMIPPHGIGWYNDNVIQLNNPPRPGTLEGYIEYEIHYGKKGNLKYSISGKKQIVVSFNEGGLLVNGSWNDAT